MTVQYKINKKLNKTGKRNVFFATINNKRISRTNFTRKWEAERQAETFISNNDETKILEWANK